MKKLFRWYFKGEDPWWVTKIKLLTFFGLDRFFVTETNYWLVCTGKFAFDGDRWYPIQTYLSTASYVHPSRMSIKNEYTLIAEEEL